MPEETEGIKTSKKGKGLSAKSQMQSVKGRVHLCTFLQRLTSVGWGFHPNTIVGAKNQAFAMRSRLWAPDFKSDTSCRGMTESVLVGWGFHPNTKKQADHNDYTSPLAGEEDFQNEQKSASSRKSGEGCNHINGLFVPRNDKNDFSVLLENNRQTSSIFQPHPEVREVSMSLNPLSPTLPHKKGGGRSAENPCETPSNSAHLSPLTSHHAAFTLAETLITLAIIGVVAAIVIPQLMTNIQQQGWNKSKDNTMAIVEEATKEMNVNSTLAGYATNEAFADEFVKYIKVSNRCTSSNLTNCFVPNFQSMGGTAITTSTLTDTTKLGHGLAFWGNANTVGLQLVNGTNVILAYNTQTNANKCLPPDWYNSSSGSYNSSTTSTSFTAGATTACLSMLFDINGYAGPNVIGKDIGELNASVAPDD